MGKRPPRRLTDTDIDSRRVAPAAYSEPDRVQIIAGDETVPDDSNTVVSNRAAHVGEERGARAQPQRRGQP